MSSFFYNGKEGKSFSINKIFSNVEELKKDLNNPTSSSVNLDDFVLIYYGEEEYSTNYKIDYENNAGSIYNNTIWKKVFYPQGSIPPLNVKKILSNPTNDVHYLLISDISAQLPNFEAKKVEDLLVNSNPEVELTKADETNKRIFQFKLPVSQKIGINLNKEGYSQDGIKLNDAYNEIGEKNNSAKAHIDYNQDDNLKRFPKLSFELPNIPDFTTDTITSIPAEDAPSASISGKNNVVTVHFNLPINQIFKSGQNQGIVVNSFPYFSTTDHINAEIIYDQEDSFHQYPKISLDLPELPDFKASIVEELPPNESPKIIGVTNDSHNTATINFQLPRSSTFHWENTELDEQIGEFKNYNQIILSNVDKYKIGDYYIYKPNGAIYYISNVNAESLSIDLEFKACLTAPNPEIKPLDFYPPYKNEQGEVNIPQVEMGYNDKNKNLSPYFKFQIPSSPTFSAGYTLIGSDYTQEELEVIKTITNNNSNVDFNFKIPRGTRWFSGTLDNLSINIPKAKKGDFYIYLPISDLDLNRGNIYKFNGTDWSEKVGNITGPIGDPIQIIGNVIYKENDSKLDTLEYISQKLEQDFPEAKDSRIVFVTFKAPPNTELFYWYFKIDGKWDRCLVPGGGDSVGIAWGKISDLITP